MIHRRRFLSYMAATVATPYIITLGTNQASAGLFTSGQLQTDSERVFSHSVAIG